MHESHAEYAIRKRHVSVSIQVRNCSHAPPFFSQAIIDQACNEKCLYGDRDIPLKVPSRIFPCLPQ